MGEDPGVEGSLRGVGRSWFARNALRGDRKTTVKDRKKEIGKGLLAKMLTDLGVDKDDF